MDDVEEYDDFLARESARTRDWKRFRSQTPGAEEMRVCRSPPMSCEANPIHSTSTNTIVAQQGKPLGCAPTYQENGWDSGAGESDWSAPEKPWAISAQQRASNAARPARAGTQLAYSTRADQYEDGTPSNPYYQTNANIAMPPATTGSSNARAAINGTGAAAPINNTSTGARPVANLMPPIVPMVSTPTTLQQPMEPTTLQQIETARAAQVVAMPVTIPVWALALILFFVGLFLGILIMLPVALKRNNSPSPSTPSTFVDTSSYQAYLESRVR